MAHIGDGTRQLGMGIRRDRLDHPALPRVYDYWLGGKDNFAADRELADTIEKFLPIMPSKVRVNRAFLGRAVRYLTEIEGIRQFLDLGAGLPTARNTHEVAQESAPTRECCTSTTIRLWSPTHGR